MIASKNPVKAPRSASVIERLLKVRSPWPVRRNPAYAIATVQRIARTGCMGDHLSMNKYCHNSPLRSEKTRRLMTMITMYVRKVLLCSAMRLQTQQPAHQQKKAIKLRRSIGRVKVSGVHSATVSGVCASAANRRTFLSKYHKISKLIARTAMVPAWRPFMRLSKEVRTAHAALT